MKKDYDSTRIYRNTQKKGASQTYDTPSYPTRKYKAIWDCTLAKQRAAHCLKKLKKHSKKVDFLFFVQDE